MRLLLLAETDSYLKYGHALSSTLVLHGIESELFLIEGPLKPSCAQVAQVAGCDVAPPQSLSVRQIVDKAGSGKYDWIFFFATGPVVAYLSLLVRRFGKTAKLASAIPGIALPERSRALQARQLIDLFVVHSHLEKVIFQRVVDRLGLRTCIALNTLPFLHEVVRSNRPPEFDCLFATQPSVPVHHVDRYQLLLTLGSVYPRVGIKVRTVRGEGPQTHHEPYPYENIAAKLGQLGVGDYELVEGPMADAVALGESFVTLSSTAALEAIGAGRYVRVVDDFGVSTELINHVFRGSNLLGPASARPSCEPNPNWMQMNYFHGPEENDLLAALGGLPQKRWRLGSVANKQFIHAVTEGGLKLRGQSGRRR